MIGRLTGTIAECSPGSVVMDVGGVGYSLQIPLSTFYALRVGEREAVTLHVYTYVREDALLLFGFASPEERRTFERLIGISGVGPRTALAVLSGIGVPDLERAVREADRGQLERIPGIGRKTAERMILELRDRIEREARPRRGRGAGGGASAVPRETRDGGIRSDAIVALEHLGYSLDAAIRGVDRALEELGEAATIELVLKAALRGLVR
ncbi:MAG: Holliday junction branch migration protein RuvA [Acidobacteriia bacterium]|nr:Holliday junction branch migration protein RuvA [Terriglobia bacterium]